MHKSMKEYLNKILNLNAEFHDDFTYAHMCEVYSYNANLFNLCIFSLSSRRNVFH